jgi:ABC-type Mn2+/Zn2+ transport system permease subunit
MEMLTFYWPNILAASLLVMVLGLMGFHLLARNQSMEVMLLGQEFQTGILVAALVQSLFNIQHDNEHGIHAEAILSFIFVLLVHGLYVFWIKNNRAYRIEGAIISMLILMGLSHLIVVLSPSVEFHMVHAALGDIVTVSRSESLLVALLAIVLMVGYYRLHSHFFQETIEIAFFNRATKKRKSSLYFQGILYLLMFISIHLFGGLFTVGSMLIPAFMSSIFQVSRHDYVRLLILNCLMVVVAFAITLIFDRLPTTVIIILSQFLFTLIFSLIKGMR